MDTLTLSPALKNKVRFNNEYTGDLLILILHSLKVLVAPGLNCSKRARALVSHCKELLKEESKDKDSQRIIKELIKESESESASF